MCWLSRIDRIPMTAEEDIPVYKVMWSTEEKDKYYSYYNEMEYSIGKEYSIEKIKPENVDFIVYGFSIRINEGFHSYDNDKVEIYDRAWFWDYISS